MHVRCITIETIRESLGLDWTNRTALVPYVQGNQHYILNVDKLPEAVDAQVSMKTYNNHRTYKRWACKLLFEAGEALDQEDAAAGYLRPIEAATLSGIHWFLKVFLQDPWITTLTQNHLEASVILLTLKDLLEKLRAGQNILENIANRHQNKEQGEGMSAQGSAMEGVSNV